MTALQPISEATDARINAHVNSRMAYERRWAAWNAEFDARLARCRADTANARALMARIEAADAPVHAAAKAALAQQVAK